MANENETLVFLTPGLNEPYSMFRGDNHWGLILSPIMVSNVVLAVFLQFLVIRHLITKPPLKRPIDYLLLAEQVRQFFLNWSCRDLATVLHRFCSNLPNVSCSVVVP